MKVVCWDFDGTLVTSDDHWAASGVDALRAADSGWNIDKAEFGRALRNDTPGLCIPWRRPFEDHTGHTGEVFWDVMNEWYAICFMSFGVPEKTARAAACGVRARLADAANYRLYPDTIAALEAVHAEGHVNALMSNNYPELPAVMEKLGLIEHFDALFISGLAGYDKPRREFFALAREKFAADEYFMVGDTLAADIIGGKNAGMKTVYVHKGHAPEADLCTDSLIAAAGFILGA